MSKAASDLEVDAMESYQADIRQLRAVHQRLILSLAEAKGHMEKVQGSFKDKVGVSPILESQRADIKNMLDLLLDQAGAWRTEVEGFSARIRAQI